ncbi:MAG TPA: PHP domain-containing protein [Nitrospiraceae bacterium]|jgi:predicted metal-dependent phosphoesterase TrpH
MGRIDLHLHTTYSDGSLSPAEVLAMADKAGVTALAITDHDIVAGLPEAIEAGSRLGIAVIPGVEISSFDGRNELHILGYHMDWHDEKLLTRLSSLRTSRHKRNPLIIERLQALGLEITYDEVIALAGTESVGRPHIARVLMEKGYVNSAKDAFDRYLAEGRPGYVARELPTPMEAIAWIREARGVAVLAHPTWVKEPDEALPVFIRALKDHGLGGLEVHYSSHTKQQTVRFLELSKQFGLLVTGGSDFHGLTKPDIEVGTGRGSLRVPEHLLNPLKEAATRL